jgi:hypothetical protein
MSKKLRREDLMDMTAYGRVRQERRRAITELKKIRRLGVGPDATCYFESYETMWHQIHEMLFIEKGGEEQVKDELNAYAPMVPNGSELVMTLMFEVDDPDRRAALLSGLGGVESTLNITVGDEVIKGVPEEDVDRTNAEGKASAIQFLHFPFSHKQIKKFRDHSNKVMISIEHNKYGHIAIVPETMRIALSEDFD